RRAIAARPLQWVGQEPLAMASTPTLTAAGLEPRRSVLRAFAVPRNDSYVVMPGGLTRVAPAGPRRLISSQNGAISKDTWVLASEPERPTGFWLEDGPAVAGLDPMGPIPSRAAENLWWLGRYAERADAVTRLLRAAFDRRNDFQGSANPPGVESLHALLAALTRITTTHPGFASPGADTQARLESPERELVDLVVDHARPGTLAHSVRALLDAAHAVRDQLSGDTWLVIGSLDKELLRLRGPLPDAQAAVQGALQQVMQSLLALGGLGAESMVRDLGWRFMDAGCRLERALQLLALLRATVTDARGTATDSLLLESVLTAAESIVTYRRRYRSRGQLETLLDMLLLDEGNPRSLAFSLGRLTEDLDALPAPRGQRLREEQRLLLGVSTALRLADTTALAAAEDDGHRLALDAFLADLHDRLSRAAAAVDRAHFVHPLPQRSLAGPADLRPAAAGTGVIG
ncbi:MAG TPA: circularly permuted type 2 ATP-grasp protein, partial [Solirubrobacteraceae bacterium]|nr:circularly permuted type 2 ATP-grasp protein [Solirubrobacteraceae bacterium]